MTDTIRADDHVMDATLRDSTMQDCGNWRTTDGLGEIIDALPFPISLIDTQQRLLFCNRAFEAWFKQPLSRIDGAPLAKIMPPPLLRAMSAGLGNVMDGKSVSSETTTAFPDGATRRVRHTYVPSKSGEGIIVGCISLIQDVTELVDTQLELGRERDLFEGIFKAMPDAIALLSAKREIFMSNPALTSRFGYRADEILGRKTEFLYQGHGEYERHNLIGSKAPLNRNSAPRTVKYRRKNGTVFTGESQTAAIHDRNGGFIANLEIMRDSSLREKTANHAAQAQMMDAIGNVTGAIAHDFNNLLMVIDGYSRRAMRHKSDSDALVEDLQAVLRAADKATRLTSQLLSFSHQELMDRSLFRVDDTLSAAETRMLDALSDDHDLRLILNDDGEHIHTDRIEFEQAILKLVENARDATPDGGTIVITTTPVTIDAAGQARTPYLLAGRYMRIDVADRGVGMAPGIAARMFEPFFTTKKNAPGAGLSLAMVYGFAQQSRGGIEIESMPQEGTVARLYMPISEKTHMADMVETPPALLGRGETILLVEDDDALLRLTREILSDLGYHVLTAANGLEALVLEENYSGDIDLMLSDVVMPGMGGFDLAEAIRAHRPALKMAFMSGYTNRDSRNGEIPYHAQFLQKPVAPDRLARSIRLALDMPALSPTP